MSVLLSLYGVVMVAYASFIVVVTIKNRTRLGTSLGWPLLHGTLIFAAGLAALSSLVDYLSSRAAIGAIAALVLSDIALRKILSPRLIGEDPADRSRLT